MKLLKRYFAILLAVLLAMQSAPIAKAEPAEGEPPAVEESTESEEGPSVETTAGAAETPVKEAVVETPEETTEGMPEATPGETTGGVPEETVRVEDAQTRDMAVAGPQAVAAPVDTENEDGGNGEESIAADAAGMDDTGEDAMGAASAAPDSVADVPATQAGDIASGTYGNVVWVIDGSGKLTVSGSGEFRDGTNDLTPWADYADQITSAELNVNGVTDLSCTFKDCVNLTEVNIASTAGVRNMSGMFWGCKSLVTLDTSSFDTSSVTVMSAMFYDCENLENLDVSHFNTANATHMSGMFRGCRNIAQLDVSHFDTSNVTAMSLMFSGCESLEALDVSHFDTGNVVDMASMFQNCKTVTQLDVSNFDTSNVTDMSWMFRGCENLAILDVSRFDTSSTVGMSAMFSNCKSVEQLDVSNFNTTNVTVMSSMFSGCESLADLTVSRFETGNVVSMCAMFQNCKRLTQLDVSSFNTSNVTDMSFVFSGCEGLVNLDVGSFETGNVTSMHAMFQGCEKLTQLDISNFNTSNVTNMSRMFFRCGSLADLNLNGFDTSNVTDMSAMFFMCEKLENIDLSGFDVSNTENLGGMFYGCLSVRNLDVSQFDTSNATDMSEMFAFCEKLENINVSNFHTSNVTDMSGMFDNCRSLTTLDVSGFDVSNVEKMPRMFGYCTTLESLDLSRFDAGKVTDMSDMFDSCEKLETIYAPLHVTVSAPLPQRILLSDASFILPLLDDVWLTADGTEVTELPKNLSNSVMLTHIKEFPAAVKYVPYEIWFGEFGGYSEDLSYTLASGSLPAGIELKDDGRIFGVPEETGDFRFAIRWSNGADMDVTIGYRFVVEENTTPNVNSMSDSGYELIEYVPDLYLESVSATGTHTLVSRGEYSEFVAVYLNGRKLTEGKDYTSASGSTRITIIDQTLTDEGEGTHTIGIEFRTADNQLRRAAQNYTVLAGKAPSDNNSNTGNNTGTSGNTGGGYTAPPAVPAEEETETVISYVVQRGDTLWKLAARYYGAGRFWTRIYQDNMGTIRSPHRLRVGQVLTIYLTEADSDRTDETMAEGTYTVKSGDSLWRIARKYYGKGSLWQLIYQANQNRIANPDRIRAGQIFTIPER